MADRLYIGFDPGVVSGMAVLSITGSEMRFTSSEWKDIHHLADTLRWHRDRRDRYETFAVATEKFTISERTIKTKIYYDSLYFCGWLSIEWPDRKEQATSCKGARTRAMLGALGWGNPTKDDHADDAGCHVLTLALRHKDPAVLAALGRSVKR